MTWPKFTVWPIPTRVAEMDSLSWKDFLLPVSPALCLSCSGLTTHQRVGREWGRRAGVLGHLFPGAISPLRQSDSCKKALRHPSFFPHWLLRWLLPLFLHHTQGYGNPCVICPSMLGLWDHCRPVYTPSIEPLPLWDLAVFLCPPPSNQSKDALDVSAPFSFLELWDETTSDIMMTASRETLSQRIQQITDSQML